MEDRHAVFSQDSIRYVKNGAGGRWWKLAHAYTRFTLAASLAIAIAVRLKHVQQGVQGCRLPETCLISGITCV